MRSSKVCLVGLWLLTGCLPMPSPARDSAPGVEAGHEDPSAPVLQQMRWKLENTDWDFGVAFPVEKMLEASPQELDQLVTTQVRGNMGGDSHRRKLHRSVEALLLDGRKTARERAIGILRKLVAIHAPGDINAIVTTHGIEFSGVFRRTESGSKVYEVTEPNAQRQTVLNVQDLAFEHAALYLLTGERREADAARAILLRFAEVMKEWPLYDRDNAPHSQDDLRYLAHSAANGLWSVWSPLDLRESLTLLRAYDIIRPALSVAERTAIEEGIFAHQKELIDRYPRHRQLYDNLQGYRLPALILFGRVLERPDYVHEAVAYVRDLLRYSFTADGFWREVTPGYHRQVAVRLLGTVPLALKGYSDPAGYTYDKDGSRFDQLAGRELFEPAFSQMEKGLNVLAMPDRTYLAIHDSWPKRDRVAPEVDDAILDQPGLLGVAGVAKLGSKGMAVFMEFGGTRGHDQDSPLNLAWFAGGREVFSETGYQAIPESGSSREWHTLSASHLTVTVNEQMNLRAADRLPESLRVAREGSPEAEGREIVAVHPTAAEYANQGELLVWRADSDLAQGMEAERERAYPGVTSLYRRAVVMIPEGNGDGTVVEIFRVRGGQTHDYALRGGLDEPYTMTFDAALRPASGTLYKYITLKQSARILPPLLATTQYEDRYQVHSVLALVSGSPGAELDLLAGEGPAIRRPGLAPFSMIRHRLDAARGELESGYVWVHEAGCEKTIRSVRAQADDGKIVVIIERDGRTDLVFSSEKDDGRFSIDGWTFTGRLAYARQTASGMLGTVFSGGPLERAGDRVAEAAPSRDGVLLATTRGPTDSLLVKLKGDLPQSWTPRLVHVDFGQHIRFSIPVEKALKEGDSLRLVLAHAPGFDLQDSKAIMTHAPGWTYFGLPTVRVDGAVVSSAP